MLQGYYRVVTGVLLHGVTLMLQEFYMGITDVFQSSYNFRKVLQVCYRVLQGCYRDVTVLLHGGYRGITEYISCIFRYL